MFLCIFYLFFFFLFRIQMFGEAVWTGQAVLPSHSQIIFASSRTRHEPPWATHISKEGKKTCARVTNSLIRQKGGSHRYSREEVLSLATSFVLNLHTITVWDSLTVQVEFPSHILCCFCLNRSVVVNGRRSTERFLANQLSIGYVNKRLVWRGKLLLRYSCEPVLLACCAHRKIRSWANC